MFFEFLISLPKVFVCMYVCVDVWARVSGAFAAHIPAILLPAALGVVANGN